MDFYIFNNGIMTTDAMSGCEQRVLNWLPFFLNKAASVTVITSSQGKRRFNKFEAVDIIETTGFKLRGKLGLLLSYLVRAVKGCIIQGTVQIANNKHSVIYSASDLIPDLIPALFLKFKRRKTRLIAGLHLLAPLPWKGFRRYYLSGICSPTLSGIYYFISQNILLSILKRVAAIVLVSNSEDRRHLIAGGFKADKVLVTYGGVNTTQIEAAFQGEERSEACYIGRFHPQKGFDDLIKAWREVVLQIPSARLVVIGYDSNLESVKEKIKTVGLQRNIKFMGFVEGVDKFSIIKASKMLVFPSYYESFGLVAAEAMACSLPVVAYHLPIYDEIYPQGMLKVDIGDSSGLAKLIVKLLTNDALRKKLGEEAYRLSDTFSWERTAIEILKRLN